jgi:hypothetical protein
MYFACLCSSKYNPVQIDMSGVVDECPRKDLFGFEKACDCGKFILG